MKEWLKLFPPLCLPMYNSSMEKIDLAITLALQSIDFVWFDLIMRFLSDIGDVIWGSLILMLFVILGILIKRYKAALMLFISGVGSVLISESIKFLIHRPRPDPLLIEQLDKFTRADSFPSGHVLFAIGVYGFLLFFTFTELKERLLLRKVLLVIFSLPVLLMGLSRIYVGAHWFSDVLGAYLIGFVWLNLVIFLYRNMVWELNRKIS